MTATECTCLTTEDSTLPHYVHCPEVDHADVEDHSDIRTLAELAANSDIDTALMVLRNYRARTAN